MHIPPEIILSLASIGVSAAFDHKNDPKWLDFKQKFNKNYENSNTEIRRYEIFLEKLKRIEEHNKNGKHRYKFGINQFSDLSSEEFHKIHLPRSDPPHPLPDDLDEMPYPGEGEFECPEEFPGAEIPAEFINSLDWRDPSKNPKNVVAVTPIKNQGACGSCYVFGAVSAMESALCLSGAKENCEKWNGLSEQHAMNCGTHIESQAKRDLFLHYYPQFEDTMPEAKENEPFMMFHGCSGGMTSNVVQFIYQNGFIVESDVLPYESGNGTRFKDTNFFNVGECPYEKKDKYDFVKSVEQESYFVNKKICGTTSKRRPEIPDEVRNADADNIKQALYKFGPLSIGIWAPYGDSFTSYESGIWEPLPGDCDGYPTNHAMNIVGYGVDEETGWDYWIVRNSWAESWGEDGYVKIRRGLNVCNMETDVFYTDMSPVAEMLSPAPEPVVETTTAVASTQKLTMKTTSVLIAISQIFWLW